MASKAAIALKAYNEARNAQSTDEIEAYHEQDYEDSTAGNVIPWFLGLDGYEKWTARWLNEKGYANIVLKKQECRLDGSCCESVVVFAGSDKPIIKLPTKAGLSKSEVEEARQQQRALAHEILTKELVRILRVYEGTLTCSANMKVHYCILQLATAVTNLGSGGQWQIAVADQEDGNKWGITEKIVSCLDDYGWRVSNWKVREVGRVRAWAERIRVRAEKHGILFDALFAAVKERTKEKGFQRALCSGVHSGEIAKIAKQVKPFQVLKYEVRPGRK